MAHTPARSRRARRPSLEAPRSVQAVEVSGAWRARRQRRLLGLRPAFRILLPAALMVIGSLLVPGAARPAGADGTWTWSVLGGPGGPPALQNPAMAYDSDNQSVVLFGGALADGSPSGQTWVFDGSSWSQSVGLSGPSARTGASMAFDAAQHQLILFGGVDASGTYLSDTWAWNGTQWYALSPAGTPPTGRSGASLAADPAGNLVLFAGTGLTPAPTTGNDGSPSTTVAPPVPGALDDTWTWNGSVWTSVTPAISPPARTNASATFDPVHADTVLFGGASTPNGSSPPATQYADTWTWDGSAWSHPAPASGPGPRSGAALVGDGGPGGAVLFGGSVAGSAAADTWSWDGASWTEQAVAGDPPARAETTGAFDAATGQVIVEGGGVGTLVLTTVPTPPPTPPPAPSSTTTTAVAPVIASATTAPANAAGQTTTTTDRPRLPSTAPVTTPVVHTTPPAGPLPDTQTASRPSPVTSPAPITRRVPARPPAQTVLPGGRVLLAGGGFRPGARVDITFQAQHVVFVTADSLGRFAVTVRVPHDADVGSHHFDMSGQTPSGAMTTQETAVLVVAYRTSRTGNTQTPVMVVTAVIIPVLTWVGLVLVGRRRTRQGQPG